MENLTSGLGTLDISGSGSPGVQSSRSSGSGDSGVHTGLPARKVDQAHNHIVFAPRPGKVKKLGRKIDVVCNYYKLNTPSSLKVYKYLLEFSKAGRTGAPEPITKKEKTGDLFWRLVESNRGLFPTRLERMVFDGVSALFTLEPLNLNASDRGVSVIHFPASGKPQGQQQRGVRGRPEPFVDVKITCLPMFKTDNLLSDTVDVKAAIVQLIDLIIVQEHRNPLLKNHQRFIQQGHSFFKVPLTDEDKKYNVHSIGMGQEVWKGLHTAVKADCPDSLYLNANTSHSLFYKRHMNLVDFYSEIVYGYGPIPENFDRRDAVITRENLDKLGQMLTGTKVAILRHDGTFAFKKFDRFSNGPAISQTFNYEGNNITVAEYFLQKYNHRLESPHLACLSFYNKIKRSSSYFPMEMCFTGEEPMKYKGRMTEKQLNAFIKAVGSKPLEKKADIDRFTATGGDYLGASEVMDAFGISMERKMLEIEQATILPYPCIEWRGNEITDIDSKTGEYSVLEGERKPRTPLQLPEKKIFPVVLFDQTIANGRPEVQADLKRKYEFLMGTLVRFGVNVEEVYELHESVFYRGRDANVNEFDKCIKFYKEKLEAAGMSGTHRLLFLFVFTRRHEGAYATIKTLCDIKYGVLSQCIVKNTFDKLSGNQVTNESSLNLFKKILAKCGGVFCKLDGQKYKNVQKLCNPEDPTLVLGIDVSHPSSEERKSALEKQARSNPANDRRNKQNRGQHEQLPSARPQAASLFEGFSFYDCPRSVVSVVGNIDFACTKYAVSSRVQRLGQEETVNMDDLFSKRILDFHAHTEKMPKHVIVYRDGISDSMFAKACYEECQSLERALEKNGLAKDTVTITYIVAKKRHHTRFFVKNPEDSLFKNGEPGNNTPPGLLVEDKIVSRTHFDFFLQSHNGTIGTVSPTHYTVLRDDWMPSPSFWQTAVFAHCFLNARCTRPLSITVPLHYAHLAAKRAKLHFDFFKSFPPDEYCKSTEDLVRESIETEAITNHAQLAEINSMYFM